MLARMNRLRHRRDIEKVFKRGRFGNAGLLTAKAWQSGNPHSRVVIVVSKKISKKAVVRNTIRRRLSGQLEELWATIPTGYDIVINARQEVSKTPVAELKKSLVQALAAAGVLRKA